MVVLLIKLGKFLILFLKFSPTEEKDKIKCKFFLHWFTKNSNFYELDISKVCSNVYVNYSQILIFSSFGNRPRI